MERTVLGKTGIEVSRLCFGALTLGPLQANFLDTAQFYQNYPHLRCAQKLVGDELTIASKTYAYTRDAAIAAVEEARHAIDRDVIDIFMLHEQESEHTFRGHAPALAALYDLKAKGVIRAVGASMHHIAAVRAATRLGLDVIHPLINVAGLGIVDGTRAEMEEALLQAHNAGIGIYTMKSLGGGNLFSRAQECFDYALAQPFADSIAVGMQSIEEIDANVHYFEHQSFSQEDQEELQKKERRILIEDWCSGCGACCDACSQKALHLQDGHAVCDPSRCILCGYCSGHCPMWSIKII